MIMADSRLQKDVKGQSQLLSQPLQLTVHGGGQAEAFLEISAVIAALDFAGQENLLHARLRNACRYEGTLRQQARRSGRAQARI